MWNRNGLNLHVNGWSLYWTRSEPIVWNRNGLNLHVNGWSLYWTRSEPIVWNCNGLNLHVVMLMAGRYIGPGVNQ